MALGSGHAFGHVFFCNAGDNVAVFRMHQRQRAELGATLERGEHLLVVDHQRALVGHEMLEVVTPCATTFAMSSLHLSDQQVMHMWNA